MPDGVFPFLNAIRDPLLVFEYQHSSFRQVHNNDLFLSFLNTTDNANVFFETYLPNLKKTLLEKKEVRSFKAITNLRTIDGRAMPSDVEITIFDENRKLYLMQIRDRSQILERELLLESFSKVIEATNRKLLLEKEKIQTLLNHLPLAAFFVNSDLKISEPISPFSTTLFEVNPKDRDISIFLYEGLGADDQVRIKENLLNVMNSDELQWELSVSEFPREVFWGPKSKKLNICYVPVWNDHGNVERILVIAQDLSDVVELKRKLEDEKKANQRIVEIAHSNKLEVKRFLGDLSLSKLEAQNKLVAKDSKVADKASYLLRKLHTIKGNSRLLKFSALTAVSHDAEKNIINQIGDSESSKLEFCLKEVLDVVFGEINLYMSVAKDVFGLSFEPVQDDKAGQCASLGEISHSWRQLGRETAIKLEKNVELQVVGDDQLLLPRKKLNILQSVVIQLITNAVDHGIESPDERILAQKDVCGHLWIEMKIEDGKNIYFSLKDDGRGIDKKKLIHRAVQKGVITEQEVVRLNDQQVLGLIFKPGLSTASVVTEYSGRGIGMDVVKNALMELGASWEIESHLGLGTEFRIRLPV